MWEVVEGASEGQTHCDYPDEGTDVVWSHPVDLHFSTKSLVGWPKMWFQVRPAIFGFYNSANRTAAFYGCSDFQARTEKLAYWKQTRHSR